MVFSATFSRSKPSGLRERRDTWGAITTVAAACVLVALTPAPARADDAKVAVTITPEGQPWSIGGHGGAACDPSCTMSLSPDTYAVQIGGAKQDLLIRVPTDITYSHGSPKLRTIAGWTAAGTFIGGGVMGAFAIYGFAKSCTPSGCSNVDFTISRPVAGGLIATGAVLVSISVAAAIVFAVSGESVTAHELAPAPEPPRRRSFDVMLSPSPGRASIDLVGRF